MIRTDVSLMDIGDKIICRYTATSNSTGTFSELGTSTATEIPVASTTTPDGSFYFIHAGLDHLGRMILIPDRNIQKGIAWDTLNSAGIASGEGLPLRCNLQNSGVAGYRFDEVSGNIVYDIQGRYNGTSSSGNARRFNGSSQYFSFSTKIIPIGAKTIKFKFRRNGNPPSNGTLFDNANGAEANHGITFVLLTDGTINFNLYKGTSGSRLFAFSSIGSICDNVWHDIVFTWDGTTNADAVEVYIDDMTIPNITGTAVTTETVAPTYNLMIGKRTSSNIDYLNGDLDDIQVLDDSNNVVLYLPMDETTSTSGISDQSGHGYTGSQVGSPAVISDTMQPAIVSDGNGGYYRHFVRNVVNFTSTVTPIGAKSIRFKIRSTMPTPMQGVILDNIGNNGSNSGLVISNYIDGTIHVTLCNGAALFSVGSITLINDGVWHDILFTWDGTTNVGAVKVYVDDMTTPDNTGTSTGVEVNTPTYNLTIGRASSTGAVPFEGDLKEIEIYNYVVSPTKSMFDLSKFTSSIRLLTGGISNTDTDNEWDNYIVNSTLNGTITAGDNAVWNWSGQWTETSTSYGATPANKVVRGNSVSGFSNITTSQSDTASTGFRPVLIIDILLIELYLFQDGTDIKQYISGAWSTVGTAPADQTMFDSYGMPSIATISDTIIRTLLSTNPKLLFSTSDLTALPQTKLTAVPPDKLILPTGDIDLTSVEGVDSFTITATESGSGIIRLIASVDSGVTWYTWNGTAWVLIDSTNLTTVITDGMTISTVNARVRADWDSLIGTARKIRFAYLESITSTTDIAETDEIIMQVDMKGSWKKAIPATEYDYSYTDNNNVQILIYVNGDYKINYGSGGGIGATGPQGEQGIPGTDADTSQITRRIYMGVMM